MLDTKTLEVVDKRYATIRGMTVRSQAIKLPTLFAYCRTLNIYSNGWGDERIRRK